MKIKPSRIGLIVLVGALAGVVLFSFLAAQVTSLTHPGRKAAMSRFEAVIDSLDSGPPRLQRDGRGKFVNNDTAGDKRGVRPSKLGVLVYRIDDDQLIQSDIPFWFFRLKGSAARFALRGSGFDMDRLGVTPRDIARQGAGVILDESFTGGDRLLVWAE